MRTLGRVLLLMITLGTLMAVASVGALVLVTAIVGGLLW